MKQQHQAVTGLRAAWPSLPESKLLRLVWLLAIAAVGWPAFRWGLGFLRQGDAPAPVLLLVATTMGVAGVWALFWSLNQLVEILPGRGLQRRVLPLAFVGPGVALLLVFLVYPTLYTFWLSLHDRDGAAFVGAQNYIFAFTEHDLRDAFVNNIMWLVVVTSVSVVLGLLIAVLVDRVRYEAAAKSLIFLPMAISFVGASVIWRFVYAYAPPRRPQIGLLNAIVTAGGGEPVGWLIERQFNNFALMAIMVWLQTGFCMVILSAALKAIPAEVIEAARMDGASERQIFFSIIIPALRGTLITVATAVLIAVLKVFDIVFVMTSGHHDTEVIANRMFAELFRHNDSGTGSALAIILLLAVVPAIVINVRNLRRQRGEQ